MRSMCVCVCQGDFFKEDLPAADLYVLARIIHDWKEEKSLTLLRKIYAACNSGTRSRFASRGDDYGTFISCVDYWPRIPFTLS